MTEHMAVTGCTEESVEIKGPVKTINGVVLSHIQNVISQATISVNHEPEGRDLSGSHTPPRKDPRLQIRVSAEVEKEHVMAPRSSEARLGSKSRGQ